MSSIQPRVKICGISSIEEAKVAIAAGASALGFNGLKPGNTGVISDQLISLISQSIPPAVSGFLLTSETNPEAIVRQYQKVNTSTIQFVNKLDSLHYYVMRRELPHVKLVQVIRVIDQKSVKEAIRLSPFDAILLDSGNPSPGIKEPGETGRTPNWDLMREIRERTSTPVFLAGGLNKDNVRQVIDHVQPFGLDVYSSVRTDGKLDPVKLKEFFDAIAGN